MLNQTKMMLSVLIALLSLNIGLAYAEVDGWVPEKGSIEETSKKKKKSKKVSLDPNLPMVLILGDSISMGYMGTVKKELAKKANVIHNPGNAGGTTKTLQFIDKWLEMQKWDVIHFNLGLHDLKRVTEPGGAVGSDDKNDPFQADLPTYSKNLEVIVKKLKESGAKLVFATTTPFLEGVSPYRDPVDVPKYNAAAVAIMEKYKVPVNDLYGLIKPHLAEVQKPKNVHFRGGGSSKMGKQVAAEVKKLLAE